MLGNSPNRAMRSLILFSLLVFVAEPTFGQSASAGGEGQDATAPALEANVELIRVRGLLDQSKLDEAESAVRRYTQEHPHNSDGYFLLGLTLKKYPSELCGCSCVYLRTGTSAQFRWVFFVRPDSLSSCSVDGQGERNVSGSWRSSLDRT